MTIESLRDPDGEPWEIMQSNIKKLHEEDHLTHEQASRLKDQIREVIDYAYTSRRKTSGITAEHFYLRINSIGAQIRYETGEINLSNHNQRIHSHVYPSDDFLTESDNQINISVEHKSNSEYPDSGYPRDPSLKPAYYKHTDPDILLDELEPLVRKIEEEDSYPAWIRYTVELHDYVTNNIKIQPQEPQQEKVQPPGKTLEYQTGDIGSQITLLASLYEAAGISCRIVITHNLEHDNWRPVLLIKIPEQMPMETIAAKIRQYYAEKIDRTSDLPLLGIFSQGKLGMDNDWIYVDPSLIGIRHRSRNDTAPEYRLNHFIYDTAGKSVGDNADVYHVPLKWREESQYIIL